MLSHIDDIDVRRGAIRGAGLRGRGGFGALANWADGDVVCFAIDSCWRHLQKLFGRFMGFCNSFIFILRRAHPCRDKRAARRGMASGGVCVCVCYGDGYGRGGRIMPPLEVAAKHLLTPKDDDEQQQQKQQHQRQQQGPYVRVYESAHTVT